MTTYPCEQRRAAAGQREKSGSPTCRLASHRRSAVAARRSPSLPPRSTSLELAPALCTMPSRVVLVTGSSAGGIGCVRSLPHLLLSAGRSQLTHGPPAGTPCARSSTSRAAPSTRRRAGSRRSPRSLTACTSSRSTSPPSVRRPAPLPALRVELRGLEDTPLTLSLRPQSRASRPSSASSPSRAASTSSSTMPGRAAQAPCSTPTSRATRAPRRRSRPTSGRRSASASSSCRTWPRRARASSSTSAASSVRPSRSRSIDSSDANSRTSLAGNVPTPWAGVYAASKAALHSMTETMRLEVKSFGINIMLVAPGAITSNFGTKQKESIIMPDGAFDLSFADLSLLALARHSRPPTSVAPLSSSSRTENDTDFMTTLLQIRSTSRSRTSSSSEPRCRRPQVRPRSSSPRALPPALPDHN